MIGDLSEDFLASSCARSMKSPLSIDWTIFEDTGGRPYPTRMRSSFDVILSSSFGDDFSSPEVPARSGLSANSSDSDMLAPPGAGSSLTGGSPFGPSLGSALSPVSILSKIQKKKTFQSIVESLVFVFVFFFDFSCHYIASWPIHYRAPNFLF